MALASIQRILSVEPIEGADRIEKVKVLGWDCVVRKGQFKVDDLCIYIEIDTWIPKVLLDDSYDGDKAVRLRTVKMKGQISQGLVLPTKILKKITRAKLVDGKDVTKYLDIHKYEKPIPFNLAGQVKGGFPSFIPKTDEVRIQSEPGLLADLRGKPYYITTKLDGTSATYYKWEGEFEVCSRNLRMKEDTGNVYWKMANKYNLKELIPDGWAIQGEICGPGIQKNPLNLTEPDLFIFNVLRIQSLKKFRPSGFFTLDEVNQVPEEEYGDSFDYTMEDLIERAKGNYPSGKRKEGIVVRSVDQRISFKVVNNDYLLKDEE